MFNLKFNSIYVNKIKVGQIYWLIIDLSSVIYIYIY